MFCLILPVAKGPWLFLEVQYKADETWNFAQKLTLTSSWMLLMHIGASGGVLFYESSSGPNLKGHNCSFQREK